LCPLTEVADRFKRVKGMVDAVVVRVVELWVVAKVQLIEVPQTVSISVGVCLRDEVCVCFCVGLGVGAGAV
jgi:hypothetical protein